MLGSLDTAEEALQYAAIELPSVYTPNARSALCLRSEISKKSN